MKTYTKTETVTRPILVIEHENDPQSPREWSNLGYFITCDSKYYSPDKMPELEAIIKQTGEEASNQESHITMIKGAIGIELGENVIAIYPVTKYEHSGVGYSLGTVKGFDHSNNGFYIVTDKSLKESGYSDKNIKNRGYEAIIKSELEVYNKYINGEVYWFELFDEEGHHEDSCGGFYNLEEIREFLPAEFKDEKLTDYLID